MNLFDIRRPSERRAQILTRRLRRVLTAVLNTLLLTVFASPIAYAQGGGGGGASGVGAKIESFATSLQTLGRPLGILSFTIIAIAFVIAPAARQWASEHKQMAGGVIFGLLLLTFIGDIVGFVMG